jgi:hypothetical protein
MIGTCQLKTEIPINPSLFGGTFWGQTFEDSCPVRAQTEVTLSLEWYSAGPVSTQLPAPSICLSRRGEYGARQPASVSQQPEI